jgi:hypothetical protein
MFEGRSPAAKVMAVPLGHCLHNRGRLSMHGTQSCVGGQGMCGCGIQRRVIYHVVVYGVTDGLIFNAAHGTGSLVIAGRLSTVRNQGCRVEVLSVVGSLDGCCEGCSQVIPVG